MNRSALPQRWEASCVNSPLGFKPAGWLLSVPCLCVCFFFFCSGRHQTGRHSAKGVWADRGNCCGFYVSLRMTEFWVCFSCCIAEQPQPVSMGWAWNSRQNLVQSAFVWVNRFLWNIPSDLLVKFFFLSLKYLTFYISCVLLLVASPPWVKHVVPSVIADGREIHHYFLMFKKEHHKSALFYQQ